MKAFQSKKAIWWSVGIMALLVGVFVWAVVLPGAQEPYGSDAPDVQVPSMRNVPDQPGTPNLQLETSEE